MNAAETIEGNEALLTEILVLLPPKSVFRFISVSKRWNHIIKDPFFHKSYSKLRRGSGDGRLLALVPTKSMSPTVPQEPVQMNILPIHHQCNITIKHHVPKWSLGAFGNSSNGLILCSISLNRFGYIYSWESTYFNTYDVGTTTHYTVFNPVTGKFVNLPTPLTKSRRLQEYYSSLDGLMCEENTGALTPNYIVVRVCDFEDRVMQIETYSSKTGEWAPSSLVATGRINRPLSMLMAPVVVNGIFHWFMYRHDLAVYDPNKNKNHLQLIKAPFSDYCSYSSVTVTRSLSPDDILWYGSISKTHLKFWKLEGTYERDTTIGRDEWILMHDISLASLYRGIEIDLSKACPFPNKVVVLDGVVSRDPLVVLLRKRETCFLYNFESKTSELVRYNGHVVIGDDYGGTTLRPFLESSFLSSYNLE